MRNGRIATKSLLLIAVILILPRTAPADDFEWWEGKEMPVRPQTASSEKASAPVQGPIEQVEQSDEAAIIRFGAGASYQVFLRMEDKLTADRIMSDFSFSWAPFGRYGELGADMSIGRDGTFVFRPNLKLFLVNNKTFGLYLEGACDVLSLSHGTEVGGGGGLGLIFGLMDNLALEVHAGASVFDLSDQSAMSLLGYDEMSPQVADSNLAILPSVSARIMARF